jgi:ParB family chromosome partitioning protein
MRLLLLPDDIKKFLLEEKISEGHCRAILGLQENETMVAAAKIVVRDQLNVREVEELVRKLNQGQKKKYRGKSRIFDEFTSKLQGEFREKFGSGVKLVRTTKGGRIIIPFEDDTELEKIYQILI